MKYFLGIDGGAKGGLVVIDENKQVIENIVMPMIEDEYDLPTLRKAITDYHCSYIALETAQAMPKQGVSSTFKIGRRYGQMEGLLHGALLPYILVRPQTWQKQILVDFNKIKIDKPSILLATRQYPQVDWKASPRCKKIHDGMTDALCIALYAHHKYYN